MRKIIYTFCLLLSGILAKAQEQQPAMADDFRSNGKIYVVIAVIALIFAALVLFLLYLERKVSSLEKKIGESSPSAKDPSRH